MCLCVIKTGATSKVRFSALGHLRNSLIFLYTGISHVHMLILILFVCGWFICLPNFCNQNANRDLHDWSLPLTFICSPWRHCSCLSNSFLLQDSLSCFFPVHYLWLSIELLIDNSFSGIKLGVKSCKWNDMYYNYNRPLNSTSFLFTLCDFLRYCTKLCDSQVILCIFLSRDLSQICSPPLIVS